MRLLLSTKHSGNRQHCTQMEAQVRHSGNRQHSTQMEAQVRPKVYQSRLQIMGMLLSCSFVTLDYVTL